MSRYRTVALTVALVGVLTLSACSDADKTAETAATTTTEVPPTASQLVATVADDLPEKMFRCDYSGDIPSYSKKTKDLGSDTASLDGTWEQFKTAGATESYITVYATSAAACAARASDTGGGHMHGDRKSFLSVIVRFPDATTAEAGYKADIFGQSRLAQVGGGATGEATGLGPNSATGVDEGGDVASHQAVWQHGLYNVFLKSENFSDEEFSKVASAQRDRLTASTGPPT